MEFLLKIKKLERENLQNIISTHPLLDKQNLKLVYHNIH